jgi:hypothetical protein
MFLHEEARTLTGNQVLSQTLSGHGTARSQQNVKNDICTKALECRRVWRGLQRSQVKAPLTLRVCRTTREICRDKFRRVNFNDAPCDGSSQLQVLNFQAPQASDRHATISAATTRKTQARKNRRHRGASLDPGRKLQHDSVPSERTFVTSTTARH